MDRSSAGADQWGGHLEVAVARRASAVALIALVVLALTLRLHNIDWDEGALLHPDERFLVMVNDDISAPDGVGGYFDTERSPLNPANHVDWYVYGTLPQFVTKGTATWLHAGYLEGRAPATWIVDGLDAVGVPLVDERGEPRFDGGLRSHLIGRLLAAVADSSTTVAVYLLARGAAGRRAGLSAALVWAVSVLPLQYAHFFVVDSFLTAAVAWTLVLSARVARGPGRGRRWWAGVVAAGVLVGVSMACKLNGGLVGVVVAAATVVARWPGGQLRWRDPRTWPVGTVLSSVAGPLMVAGVVAAAVFRVAQPYAFDGWSGLSPRWLADLRLIRDLQAGMYTPSSVQWAGRTPFIEPVGHLVRFGFGVPASILASVGVWSLARGGGRRRHVTPALLALWLGLWWAGLPRLMPVMRYLLPIYPVLAVLAGCGVAHLLGGDRLRRGVAVVLLVGSMLWGAAYLNGVHGQEHPRLTASAWLVDNTEPGEVVSHQEWDDPLPVWSEEAAAHGLVIETIRPYDLIDPAAVRDLVSSLDRIDLVVESSDRISASVPRMPARFGAAVRYYEALADGSLGFDAVATFSTRPELFGVAVDDGGSEESFRVYDHPTVTIWRKTERFTPAGALRILQPERTRTQMPVPLTAASANAGMAADRAPTPLGPTFDEVFHDRLPAPALWWLVWWQVLALAALGWLPRVLRSLPDRGIGLAPVVGPVTVVVPLWLLVASGLVTFSAGSVAVATAVAVAIGVGPRGSRRTLVHLWREHRRTLLTVQAVVLGAFLAGLALRSANPDLWHRGFGGEKPFETAYFTSVVRSGSFPAPDPWFSGGTMNYYAGSWFGLAVPTRLLGIPPEVALNLGLATVLSLTAATAWSVGTALVTGPGRRVRAWPGLVTAGAVLVMGNLASARQQVERAVDGLSGRAVAPFDWWAVSRLNPGTADINEFPGWAVLFGDAHPHLLTLPLVITVVGLAVGYVRTRLDPAAGPRRATAVAALAGVGLGWVRVSHTWDLPTLMVLCGAALVLAPWLEFLADPASGRGRRVRCSLIDGAMALGLSWLVARPHVRAVEVFDRGLVASPAVTPLGSYLQQYAGFLVLLVLAVTVWLTSRQPSAAPEESGRSAGSGTGPTPGGAGAAVIVVGALLVLVGWRGPVLALVVVAVGAAMHLAVTVLRSGRVGPGLAAGLVAAGFGLSGVAEVAVVRNDIGRANTVFKFGFTAWTLLALGSVGLVVWVWGELRDGAIAAGRSPGPLLRRLVVPVLAVAVVPGLIFWPSAAPSRLATRFRPIAPTLDGRAWLDHGPAPVTTEGVPEVDVTEDEPLIAWLRAHGRQGETIVEAVGASYSWVGRVSVATGLPTVLGWRFHQIQQRRPYAATVEDRAVSVEALYSDPDRERTLRTLAAFRPTFVVVGTLERALGDPAALVALADQRALIEVFRHGETAIHRVDLERVDEELARIDAAHIGPG